MTRRDAFLAEIVEVSKRHGLCLSHEDGQGAFEVDDLNDYCIEWLLDAFDRSIIGSEEVAS